MSDHCKGLPVQPVEPGRGRHCPFTARYWSFLDRNRDRLKGNNRMARPIAGLDRLADLHEVVAQSETEELAALSLSLTSTIVELLPWWT